MTVLWVLFALLTGPGFLLWICLSENRMWKRVDEKGGYVFPWGYFPPKK